MYGKPKTNPKKIIKPKTTKPKPKPKTKKKKR